MKRFFAIIGTLLYLSVAAMGQVYSGDTLYFAHTDTLEYLPQWSNSALSTLLSELGDPVELEMKILAWYSQLNCGKYRYIPCDTMHSLLTWAHYRDSIRQERWAIIWLVLPPATTSYTLPNGESIKRWSIPIASMSTFPPPKDEPEYSFFWEGKRIYNYKPTNKDIYGATAEQIFEHDTLSKDFFDTLNQSDDRSSLSFIEGAVRKRTWKAVVGENPKKYLSQGK